MGCCFLNPFTYIGYSFLSQSVNFPYVFLVAFYLLELPNYPQVANYFKMVIKIRLVFL